MSSIAIQLAATLSGVVVILIGLFASELITSHVAQASVYEVRFDGVRANDSVLDACVFKTQPMYTFNRGDYMEMATTTRYGVIATTTGTVFVRNEEGQVVDDDDEVVGEDLSTAATTTGTVHDRWILGTHMDADNDGEPDVAMPGDPVFRDLHVDNNPVLNCGLDSFAGSQAVLFLVPIVWYLFILTLGLSMIGFAGLGFAGRGPLAGGR